MNDACYALARFSVPQRRHRASFSSPGENGVHFLLEACHIGTHQYVGSYLHGDGPFRVLPYCQAGNTQKGCLFLDAAGIGYHQSRLSLQAEELQIANWLDKMQVWREVRGLQLSHVALFLRASCLPILITSLVYCNLLIRPSANPRSPPSFHDPAALHCG